MIQGEPEGRGFAAPQPKAEGITSELLAAMALVTNNDRPVIRNHTLFRLNKTFYF
jgi:hypothetical protein